MSDALIQIEVAQVEFHEGGRAIWVHDVRGSTVLRIQCTGQVKVRRECENICCHADINVVGNIEVCIVGKKRRAQKRLEIA